MNVKKSTNKLPPGYPTQRQLLNYGVIVGAAAVTLGATTGCVRRFGGAMAQPIEIEPEIMRTGGVMAPEPRVDSYVVQKGDTLYGIAKRSLGNGNRWRDLAAANPGVTPGNLKPGQTLRLPEVSPQ